MHVSVAQYLGYSQSGEQTSGRSSSAGPNRLEQWAQHMGAPEGKFVPRVPIKGAPVASNTESEP